MLNQIDLFGDQKSDHINFLENVEDWNLDEKLSKEFETLGFYISDHPLNQYKSIFKNYNITNYDNFERSNDILSSNIACTVLKVQEKKTQKGNSYGIVKFSDLTNVFELFVFAEVFETNRSLLIEGKSIMITLFKNYVDSDKSQKRINVKKIISLKELINEQIKNITFKFSDIKELNILKSLSSNNGETLVKILLEKGDNIQKFQLKDRRNITNQTLNTLKLVKNIVTD